MNFAYAEVNEAISLPILPL